MSMICAAGQTQFWSDRKQKGTGEQSLFVYAADIIDKGKGGSTSNRVKVTISDMGY